MDNKKERAWVFTVNNPKEEIEFDGLGAQYLIYQKEKGESGTEHYQGYVYFKNAISFTSIKKKLPEGAHIEKRKGTHDEAAAYCRKADTRIEGPFEFGTPPEQGKRRDLEEAANLLKTTGSLKRVAEEFPTIIVKYPRGMDRLEELLYKPKQMEELKWKKWQSELLDRIRGPTPDREIYWYVDERGGAGKTTIAEFLCRNLGALVITGGTYTQIGNQFRDQRVVVFDFERDKDHTAISYSAIEAVKNGYCAGGMYGRPARYADERPHVVVFANFHPKDSAFSERRLQLVELSPDDE